MSVLETTVSPPIGTGWDEFMSDLEVGVIVLDEFGGLIVSNDLAASLLQVARSELRAGERPPDRHLRDDTGAPLLSWPDLASQALRANSSLSLPLVIARPGQPRTRLWADLHPVRCQGSNGHGPNGHGPNGHGPNGNGHTRIAVLLQPVHTDVPHSRGLLDPLTGLPGRALLLDRLEQALVRARGRGTLASLVLLDVHRLADFNLRHGFARGDELLGVLSARLRQGMPEENTVARYGGDEFAMVAEHPSGTGESIAQRARDVAGRPVRVGRSRVRPGLRISWVTTDGNTPVHSVLDRAEEQLHARCA